MDRHAWLTVEAYRKLERFSHSAEGKRRHAEGLVALLGHCLADAVAGSAGPGHGAEARDSCYRYSAYRGEDRARHVLSREEVEAGLQGGSAVAGYAFGLVPGDWWQRPYSVKEGGGRLPHRIAALHGALGEELRLGDRDFVALAGQGTLGPGAEGLEPGQGLGPRSLALLFGLLGRCLAEAHEPFRCDSRALAQASGLPEEIERAWGDQLPALFHTRAGPGLGREDLLRAPLPQASHFRGLDLGSEVRPLRQHGNPWKEAVLTCRASFAASYALVPPEVAPVDDRERLVGLHEILASGFCGEDNFWSLSRAIMVDSVNAIAAFWLDAWQGLVPQA